VKTANILAKNKMSFRKNNTLFTLKDIFYLQITGSGIGDLVEPMVWYYQPVFDALPGWFIILNLLFRFNRFRFIFLVLVANGLGAKNIYCRKKRSRNLFRFARRKSRLYWAHSLTYLSVA